MMVVGLARRLIAVWLTWNLDSHGRAGFEPSFYTAIDSCYTHVRAHLLCTNEDFWH